jgi:hypothetical protein
MAETRLNLSLIDLLLFPVTIPVKGFMLVVEQLHSTVYNELYDQRTLQRKLLEVELEYELGNLEFEEYERLRSQLVECLAEVAGQRGGASE